MTDLTTSRTRQGYFSKARETEVCTKCPNGKFRDPISESRCCSCSHTACSCTLDRFRAVQLASIVLRARSPTQKAKPRAPLVRRARLQTFRVCPHALTANRASTMTRKASLRAHLAKKEDMLNLRFELHARFAPRALSGRRTGNPCVPIALLASTMRRLQGMNKMTRCTIPFLNASIATTGRHRKKVPRPAPPASQASSRT